MFFEDNISLSLLPLGELSLLWGIQLMADISNRNPNIFRNATVSDKISFLNSLMESGDLTEKNALALIHDIHKDLSGLHGKDPDLLREYRLALINFQSGYPKTYQAVFPASKGSLSESSREKELPTPDTDQKPRSASSRFVRYLIRRILTIAITIFIGVFITVVLANLGGNVEGAVRMEIFSRLDKEYPGWRWGWSSTNIDPRVIANEEKLLEEQAGLNLPLIPRTFVLTFRALSLNWKAGVEVLSAPGSSYTNHQARDIVLADLPHTLLLVGFSYLLLFMFGIPISLFLFRREGKFTDRLFAILSPISSIPTWVIGILLIMLFAVNLRLLPVAGMYDLIPAANTWEKIGAVIKHMALPVLSIFLSLFFQYIYSWRTIFLLRAEEDYVDLGIAKGLPESTLDRRYILRPSMPFVVTSFAIMLVSFWQMTTALEKVFNWPGIGRLYILTLPNFFGESFYPGVMSITLSIVVLFAYILGITVLLLDISYALLDPRIRLGTEEPALKLVVSRIRNRKKTKGRNSLFESKSKPIPFQKATSSAVKKVSLDKPKSEKVSYKKEGGFKDGMREILRYPSAIFGLTIILLLVIGSIVAVTAFPYQKIGEYWYTKSLTGKITVPKLAKPTWVNWFLKDPLPSSMVWDSRKDASLLTASSTTENGSSKTYTINLDYNYSDFPQNLIIYFDDSFVAKRPFATIQWTTPDGRKFEVAAADTTQPLDFSTNLKIARLLNQNPAWKDWFQLAGNYPTPQFMLLFADPSKSEATLLKGKYTLTVTTLTFEKNSDVNLELDLVGQVYGTAGTDFMRRDLIVPILWGMPFALIFGLLGAVVTTFLSMAISATGVWFGGWVDQLIQRLVEANMVLPIVGISVLIYSYLNASIWTILAIIVVLNIFSSPIKSFRSALLQVKESPYLEAARSYGATNFRIIIRYLVPAILPVLIPQLVTLIPSYVFLEATLGLFNVRSDYPTWGRVIYDSLRYSANWGSPFWVLEPLALLLLTGLAFTMLGFALEKILNPKLRTK